jgi:hypothetical protein
MNQIKVNKKSEFKNDQLNGFSLFTKKQHNGKNILWESK